MKNSLGLLFLFLGILVLNGCKKPEEAPTFKNVGNFVVKEVVDGKALVTADVTFYNPNDVKMKLKKVDIDVWVKDKQVGEVNQTMNFRIPKKADFTVPLEATVDINKLGTLNSLLFALTSSKLPIQLKGEVRAKVHGLGFTAPIDYKDEVDVNLSNFRF